MTDSYNSTPGADFYEDHPILGGGVPEPASTVHYVSTPNADAFCKTTGTLVSNEAAGDAWAAAHSIIDSFVSQDTTTTVVNEYVPAMLRTDEAVIPLSRERTILLESTSDLMKERDAMRAASNESSAEIARLEARLVDLVDKNARYSHALRASTKELNEAKTTLAERDAAYHAALFDARDARFTLGALRRTLTEKENEQFEEGLRHLHVAEANERDIEDAERENAHLQTEMSKQRAEFTARYKATNQQIDALLTTIANAGVDHATLVADVHTQIGIMLEAGKIESDYHRNRNEMERNKQTIFRAKQIAAEHALSGRALICAAFARSPELPSKPKLTVDEKLALANLQSMEE
ncbi:hypothetical protein CcrColossus_gp048 [Caulobacter phage CcrColossus]|uniref:Uncharacterized protein n=1 Tax=Caulobacter phage CcrColossus TaxID=1211640 RepID=K4JVP7_9CAUD|nr:hypothetical protein CcrColossus_gp048 [Caulobacter phage CcrColossus]AFU87918.1 hypothetical protein CcrColossus_gp048 [Caulobacter phage CcrColossus]